MDDRSGTGQIDRSRADGLGLLYERRARYPEGAAVCRKAVEWLKSQPEAYRPGEDDLLEGTRLRVLAHALAWQDRFAFMSGQNELAGICFSNALAVLDGQDLRDQDIRRERAFTLLSMSEQAQPIDITQAKCLAERCLALYQALGDDGGMAQALVRLGAATYIRGDYEGAQKRFERSLALARAAGDRRESAWALAGLGLCAKQMGDLEAAERFVRESMSAAEAAGGIDRISDTRFFLRDVLGDNGRFAESLSLSEEVRVFYRAQGARRQEIQQMISLGMGLRHLGRYPEAREWAQIALPLCSETGPKQLSGDCYRLLGCVALAEGTCREAQEWLQKNLAIYELVGARQLAGETMSLLACAARGLGQPLLARQHVRLALRAANEFRARDSCLLVLFPAALLLVDAGEVERAVELYALANHFPYVANSRWFEDIAGKHITAAAATLPRDVVRAAQELWATVQALLSETVHLRG